jgi:5-(carboxyamino)imidazole ribonucleotide synthase
VAAEPALKPGDTIGILGGGQLGRMLAMAAARLGYRTAILDPDRDCPAAQVANRHVAAAYEDEGAIAEFAGSCSVVTYEFENVPVTTAITATRYAPVRPGPRALETAQDRAVEKDFLNSVGIATAPFAAIAGPQDFSSALAICGTPSILKTRRSGYDGKGQANVAAPDELAGAFAAIGEAAAILEKRIDFAREISVIAARGTDGEFVAYDPPENVHSGGILRSSAVPARIDSRVASSATSAARNLLDSLDYVGVAGIEFFVTLDNRLLANEFAPRVHNSGHWTEAACAISQFEQHIRAVAGLSLGSTARHSDCIMENLIGDEIARLPQLLAEPRCVVHHYGKAETRPGRKMGHFTRLVGRG